MDYTYKIGIIAVYCIVAILIYFLFNKYFSKKEKLLKRKLEEPKVLEEIKVDRDPKILNDLQEEDTIFSNGWETEDDTNFSIEDHEIEDPYRKKTLDDVFKEKKDIDLDQDVKDLLN
ncbi:hypothetical protein HN014_22290 (plasmid) [Aquimarina sp. TRL1]|uniref:hypothetical protein n=1 Tax=Aquimarina sp. (strain TRL1) TaxID=2736252 RepID=UPI00158C007B|nr:hypothetical protein [Aquimarina sp. TRL1]QKX07732.1 hypothetical protein HN014_22290 [Aquimarina sp. TRL1]